MSELQHTGLSNYPQITQLVKMAEPGLKLRLYTYTDLIKNFWAFLIITVNLSTRVLNITDQNLGSFPDSVLR